MKPAFCKISSVNIDGRGSNRLMIVLKTKGCEYAQKTGGGCTVCGFLNHAEPNITGEEMLDQLDFVLKTFDLAEVEEIDILTLGSFLNDSEVNPVTRLEIITRLSEISHLKRVSIESRAEYVTVDKIKQIKEILGKGKIMEFAIGLESSNDYLRNKIIKKGLSKQSFEKTVAKVKEAGVHLLTYLLIKPPHVSEKEAITDAVESAAYVFHTAGKIGVSARVAFEPVFVCENTHLETLYLQSQYRLLNLWSVVEVIKKAHDYGCLFIGLSDENLSLERMPHSCTSCGGKIIDAIERFNKSQDISEILDLDCQCKSQYIERREKGEI
ncbi:MAG: archaeosine biosynthesis radical SAM protein RaSEA [Candidatus Aminicenantes bacterium]|nr:archaeosine biosynthesis radical SAM protein RaSEA [Candidatus Aminicenantes bacterium]